MIGRYRRGMILPVPGSGQNHEDLVILGSILVHLFFILTL